MVDQHCKAKQPRSVSGVGEAAESKQPHGLQFSCSSPSPGAREELVQPQKPASPRPQMPHRRYRAHATATPVEVHAAIYTGDETSCYIEDRGSLPIAGSIGAPFSVQDHVRPTSAMQPRITGMPTRASHCNGTAESRSLPASPAHASGACAVLEIMGKRSTVHRQCHPSILTQQSDFEEKQTLNSDCTEFETGKTHKSNSFCASALPDVSSALSVQQVAAEMMEAPYRVQSQVRPSSLMHRRSGGRKLVVHTDFSMLQNGKLHRLGTSLAKKTPNSTPSPGLAWSSTQNKFSDGYRNSILTSIDCTRGSEYLFSVSDSQLSTTQHQSSTPIPEDFDSQIELETMAMITNLPRLKHISNERAPGSHEPLVEETTECKGNVLPPVNPCNASTT